MYEQLAHEIIKRAVVDVLSPSSSQRRAAEARAWLRGPECRRLCALLGLDGTPEELLNPRASPPLPKPQRRRRCTETTEDGRRCIKWAVPGQEFCEWHGGKDDGQ